MLDEKQTEAFVQLIAQFQRRLCVYIRTLIPQRQDADEVLQEVNLHLWRNAHEYQPGTDFGAWAYKIAYYSALTHRKKLARQKLRFSDALIEQLADGAAAVAVQTDRRQEALENCLKKLPEGDREIVRARYEDNATAQAVADRIGRSLKAVYHALGRIQANLLNCVQRTLRAEAEL